MTKTAQGARGHGHDRHRPADFDAFVGRMLDPARSRWQKRERVLGAAGIRRGTVVADVGAGPGYFTLALARAVGPRGHVYAVDPEPKSLELVREQLRRHRVRNVTPILSRGDDPHLPAGASDVAMIVNTYHHFPNGPKYLERVARALRPGGRLVAIDFEKRETPVGPPVDHRIAREDFLRDAARAGLALEREHRFLPYQYFVVLRPVRASRSRSARASSASSRRRSTAPRRR